MIAAINDLSFLYQMPSLTVAVEKLLLFSAICKDIEKGYMTNIQKIVIMRDYDYSHQLAPGYILPQIIQRFPTQDERRYLMSVLTRRDAISFSEGEEPFSMDGKSSILCAAAKEDVVVSLFSSPLFAAPVLSGTCGGAETTICNISQTGHIKIHETKLGIRHYSANAVKHKPNRANIYGKGREASPMDLDEETAQELLNHAIVIEGRLYAKRHGRVYAFMEERPNVFHGYIDDDVPESVTRELDKRKWE